MKAKRCDSTTLDPTTEVQSDFDDIAIEVEVRGHYSNLGAELRRLLRT